jgi:hypothetical protein
MYDKFGNVVEIISSRGRYWYVRNIKTNKAFHTNKNTLKEISEAELKGIFPELVRNSTNGR